MLSVPSGAQIGDRLDAQDCDGRWFESVIVDERSNDTSSAVKVHFRGWDRRWDVWLPRSCDRLQQHWTKVC